MRIRWTAGASYDLKRFYDFLEPVNRRLAAETVQRLRSAPSRLLVRHPRLGVRIEGFGQREIRRLFVGEYEMRYEIRETGIVILRLWHVREDR